MMQYENEKKEINVNIMLMNFFMDLLYFYIGSHCHDSERIKNKARRQESLAHQFIIFLMYVIYGVPI